MTECTTLAPTKYKFLKRTIEVSDYPDPSHLLAYAKMRNIRFRQIKEFFLERRYKPYYYPKGKQLNYLTSLQTVCIQKSHDINILKHSKNLKKISLSSPEDFSLDPVNHIVRRLPKNIERITIYGEGVQATGEQIQCLYKTLSMYRKLESITKDLIYFDRDPLNRTEIEYDSINRFLPRLQNLKQLCCIEPDYNNRRRVEKVMAQGQFFPNLTELTFQKREEEHNFKIPVLLQSGVFPNLQKVELIITGEGLFSDQGVIQGFKALTHLRYLDLCIREDSENASHLYESLLQLPLLDAFKLSIHNGCNDEQRLLIEFLNKQVQLVSFSLVKKKHIYLREEFDKENSDLEMICQSLNNKKKLQYLYLNGISWSLESLSRGLNQVEMTNQLKEFEINFFDDISVASTTPDSKVEGLCNFIKRQKHSLRSLKITIGCLKDDCIFNSLVNAIGEAEKLRSLRIEMNNGFLSNSLSYNMLLKDIPKEPLKGFPSFQESYTCLCQALQRLTELSSLHINLERIIIPPEIPDIPCHVILNALPALKELQSLTLMLPTMFKPNQLSFVAENKTLTRIRIWTDTSNNAMKKEFEKQRDEVLEKTKQQRYIKSKLTF